VAAYVPPFDPVDESSEESFPASDSPAWPIPSMDSGQRSDSQTERDPKGAEGTVADKKLNGMTEGH